MLSRISSLGTRSVPLVAGTAIAVVLASAAVFATTYTIGAVTLTVPSYTRDNPLYHCEPQEDAAANHITLAGLPAGSLVRLNWIFSSDTAISSQVGQTFSNQSGTVEFPVPYPEDTTAWPIQNGTSRAINVTVQVSVQSGTTAVAKFTRITPWKVVCVPDEPPGDFNGCTPGYWRQVGEPWANSDAHLDSWTPTGYAPGDDFETVFSVNASFNPDTLGDAVWLNGGGENAMARHAVAALLNAASPGVNYPMSVGQVIAAVQNAYSTGDFEPAHLLFEGYNEAKDEAGKHLCPLN